VNYEDPHYNVGLPVFTIHGNHDDPAGVVWVVAWNIAFASPCFSLRTNLCSFDNGFFFLLTYENNIIKKSLRLSILEVGAEQINHVMSSLGE